MKDIMAASVMIILRRVKHQILLTGLWHKTVICQLRFLGVPRVGQADRVTPGFAKPFYKLPHCAQFIYFHTVKIDIQRLAFDNSFSILRQGLVYCYPTV